MKFVNKMLRFLDKNQGASDALIEKMHEVLREFAKAGEEGDRDAAKDARETAREIRELVREDRQDFLHDFKEARNEAKEALKEAREDVREAREALKQARKEGDREAIKEAREALNEARDARKEAREDLKAAREDLREARKDWADGTIEDVGDEDADAMNDIPVDPDPAPQPPVDEPDLLALEPQPEPMLEPMPEPMPPKMEGAGADKTSDFVPIDVIDPGLLPAPAFDAVDQSDPFIDMTFS